MSDPATELITFHGWGFSPQIWEDWEKRLTGIVRIRHGNRGYFGEPNIPSFTGKSGRKVIMTHSYGLHWCPESLLREADALVVLSGFLSFHPSDPGGERRSKLVVRQMMSHFVEKPLDVLGQFYRNVYAPGEAPDNIPGPMDHDRLLADLERLNSSVLNPEQFTVLNEVIIIHGSRDRIVSNERARDLYSLLLSNARYFEVKEGGHAVGFCHVDECIRFLNSVFHNEPEVSRNEP